MVIVPLLVSVSVPALLKRWLSRLPASVRPPALVIALVPGSSSRSPLKVALAPLWMSSVRPAKLVLAFKPLAVRSAPLASRTVPPPAQFPPLHVEPVPVSVTIPAPVSVPPLCVSFAVLTLAPKLSVPPGMSTSGVKLAVLTLSTPLPLVRTVPAPLTTAVPLSVWVPALCS